MNIDFEQLLADLCEVRAQLSEARNVMLALKTNDDVDVSAIDTAELTLGMTIADIDDWFEAEACR